MELTPELKALLEYRLQKGFIKSRQSYNTQCSQLQKGKMKLKSEQLLFVKLLQLPMGQAIDILEAERKLYDKIFNNQK